MRDKLKSVYEMIYGRDYELRERIFRMIILVGGTLALMGIVECLIIMDVKVVVHPLLLLLVVLGIELLITFKYRKIDVAAVIIGFLIILVIFPAMFLLSGGLVCSGTVLCVFNVFGETSYFLPCAICSRGCFDIQLCLLPPGGDNTDGV